MTTATHQEKLGAYDAHQRQDEDVREIDKRALLACASRMKAAIDGGGKDMNAYADAIRHNQRLWTIFQVALCDPDNQLPKDLKVTLLNLSRYVDKVSFQAITGFAPELLANLIDINRRIADGLAKNPGAAQAPPQHLAPPPPVGTTSVMTTA